MKIYMIGIGGSSMSFLAKMLASLGHTVCGSDKTRSSTTDGLVKEGFAVHIGHDEPIADVDAVVYTGGVGLENPQLLEATARKIPMLERAQLLGLLSLEYEHLIAVAGTHGKTTTAAMIALLMFGFQPTLHIGAEGSFLGSKKFLVTEACEYRNSFLTLKPDCAVILNIECDHPDFYHTPEALTSSFTTFASKVREGGLLLIEEKAAKIMKNSNALTFGEHGDYSYQSVVFEGAKARYDLYRHGERLGRVKLSIDGAQWIEDSLAAIAVALEYGVDWTVIAERITTYQGTKRRSERVGILRGAEVILDYAHHPTQIHAAIDTTHRKGKHAVVVFQPHTYSRTKALWGDFITALAEAEKVILTDIFAARESNDGSVSSRALASSLAARGVNAVYAPTFVAAAKKVEDIITPESELLILGAGNIVDLVKLLPIN